MFKYKNEIITTLLCGVVFATMFCTYTTITSKNENITALADTNVKQFKWTKRVIEEGTTVDAAYLWPDETNSSFTAVYRDGKRLADEKMVTITTGGVYHFRGISDKSVLYTEVYVGSLSTIDITSGETGTWYRLLPSAIRNDFEEGGWVWETGWEYTGRAYLDTENNRVMIKSNDFTAVLYGIGLYLDNKYDYADDTAFIQEGTNFTTVFGNTENLFASALEYYYTKGGQLRSTCPKIYAMIAESLSELDSETAQIRENTMTENIHETKPENRPNPVLMTELLKYVNIERTQADLPSVTWDSVNDDNVIIRAKEVSVLFSQTRPDGTDAFSAYTDAVMCEMRIINANTVEDIFDSAASYFLMEDMISFNCTVYGNITVLIFIW